MGTLQGVASLQLICGEPIPYGYIGAYSMTQGHDKVFIAKQDADLDTFDFPGVIVPDLNAPLQSVDANGLRVIPTGERAIVVFRHPGLWLPVETPIENLIIGFPASVRLSGTDKTPGILTTAFDGGTREVQGAFVKGVSPDGGKLKIEFNMSLNDV